MYLKTISFQGVRNLKPGKLDLSNRLNIILGLNGAGKSSLLESIGLLTVGRSFRTSKLDTMVSHNADEMLVVGHDGDKQTIGISYTKASKLKNIKIRGEKVNRLSQLTSLYPTQVISPESYHLIDSGPSERRKYLDWCLFHVKHDFYSVWKSYNNLLSHRNALLKNQFNRRTATIAGEIDSWNKQLCELAELISAARTDLLKQLTEGLKITTESLSLSFSQDIQIAYYPGYGGELLPRLQESYEKDKKLGYTQYGPHKADLKIQVDGNNVKDYLSRGQKKVLINAMLLAQTNLLKASTNKASLFLIDDFSSELDEGNQQKMLDLLMKQENVQIFIACLQSDSLSWLKKRYNNARLFHVKQGEISPYETP